MSLINAKADRIRTLIARGEVLYAEGWAHRRDPALSWTERLLLCWKLLGIRFYLYRLRRLL
mgnify:CR=1 FL=1